jgi:hypothetical protein
MKSIFLPLSGELKPTGNRCPCPTLYCRHYRQGIGCTSAECVAKAQKKTDAGGDA